MAKKIDPADLPVEQKLKNLYQLQTTLSEIDRIKTLRGELPLEVQDLEDEIEGLTTRVNKFTEEVEGLKTEIEQRRAKIVKAQELLARYDEQLHDVKNNRQYDMLQKEIDYQKLDVQLHEKRIVQTDERIAALTADCQKAEEQIRERTADLDVKKSELDDIVSETKAEEEKLREKAKSYEVQIEPRLLTAFKRIRKNSRNGLGIVYVQRDSCGGCFNKVPPQRQLDVRMRKKIIVCEYCGRILIDPELAGVKLDKPTDAKPKRRSTRKTAKKA